MTNLIINLIPYCVLALAVLLQHINLPEVTIAFDGSVYEKHPKFRIHIADLLAKLVPTTKVRIRWFHFSYLHTKPNYSQKIQRSKHCLHCSFFYLIFNFSAKARLRYMIYSQMISISNCFSTLKLFVNFCSLFAVYNDNGKRWEWSGSSICGSCRIQTKLDMGLHMHILVYFVVSIIQGSGARMSGAKNWWRDRSRIGAMSLTEVKVIKGKVSPVCSMAGSL